MKTILGHIEAKKSLESVSSSFVLLGPAGVGKSLLVREWADRHPLGYELVTDLSVTQARDMADASVRSAGTLWVLDLGPTPPAAWGPLLKPLEEGLLTLAISTDGLLPPPMLSRLQVLCCGYLSEQHVSQILAKEFPKLGPRPVLARLANGSLDRVQVLAPAAKTFETFEKSLTNGKVPPFKENPESIFRLVQSLCASRLSLPSLPFAKEVVSLVNKKLALNFVMMPTPPGKHEARNLLSLFFAQVV